MLATANKTKVQNQGREIVSRTRGYKRGPIARLVSPGDRGDLMKPFVFLDHFVFTGREPPMNPDLLWHPHSGIATVTVVLDGSIQYAETTGKSGFVQAGGVEWMRASGGVWHTGAAGPGPVRGFQLWVALPPELENGPVASHYATPESIPTVGPARVILGKYGKEISPIDAPPLTYLQGNLQAGGRWSYQPAPGHDVAWAAVDKGTLRASGAIAAGEVAIFEESADAIDFVAEGDTRFVVGSAPKHAHELALGNYS